MDKQTIAVIAIVIATFGAGILVGDRFAKSDKKYDVWYQKQSFVSRYINVHKPSSDGQWCDFEYIFEGNYENCY